MKRLTTKNKIKVSDLNFSENLFWDINIANLDIEQNKRFIMQRVLEYGTLIDWHVLKKTFGIQKIGEEMTQVRSLDKYALAFISLIANIKKTDFRCYNLKQLNPQHWNF